MSKYWFDHIHLMSPDPVKTAEFYQKMFGASLVNKRDLGNGRVVVTLEMGEVRILISPSAGDGQNGLVHFGIRADNLDEAVGELKAKGVQFTREITPVRLNLRISFLSAPENVSVELQEGRG